MTSARIQTWFPFDICVCLNGREWLSRQMDRMGMEYRRGDNCFLWIEDLEPARRLMDRQLCLRWAPALRRIARRLNPAHGRIFRSLPIEYYWTVQQSEWITDLMFRWAGRLAALCPAVVRGAMESFPSPDVMRFLGKKPRGAFAGKVSSGGERPSVGETRGVVEQQRRTDAARRRRPALRSPDAPVPLLISRALARDSSPLLIRRADQRADHGRGRAPRRSRRRDARTGQGGPRTTAAPA